VRGYLVDTNIVVYWFDARRPQYECVVRHIQELPEATPLMISAITLGEIEFGLQVAKASTPGAGGVPGGSPGLYRHQFAHGA
jgi:tRNA(fMet)-specific endonuclease VapC